ncbi:unnamed protein product [Rangifer tarandus platyrhynchus]|uniref:Uncharacterized protein n=1 Tax=Rangifer tarandus platyrhynchus TaxID=3082113 RepID=A0AC60A9V3_RANTA
MEMLSSLEVLAARPRSGVELCPAKAVKGESVRDLSPSFCETQSTSSETSPPAKWRFDGHPG